MKKVFLLLCIFLLCCAIIINYTLGNSDFKSNHRKLKRGSIAVSCWCNGTPTTCSSGFGIVYCGETTSLSPDCSFQFCPI